MSFNLRNRSLLTVQDYTQREFRYLLVSPATSSGRSTPGRSKST